MRVRVYYEVAGGPKEFLEQFLNRLIAELRGLDYVKILKEKVVEPIFEGNLWTSFAELELEFKSFEDFMKYFIDYTPSSIEIIVPSNLLSKLNK